MVIDSHAHYGKVYYPVATLTATDIVAYMARLAIDVTIISSTLAIIYDFRQGNRELAKAIQDYPQLLGYVTINFNYLQESLEELSHYLGPGGNRQFVGVKVHPLLAGRPYDTAEGMALTRAVADYGVPILVHTLSSPLESPWKVVPAAKANPSVPIILGHMGGDAWWDAIQAAQESSNLYLEICSTWTDPEKIRAAIDAIGAERVLFGTDGIWFDPSYMLGAVDDAGLSSEEWELLMGENAHRLFNLALPPAEKDGRR